MAAAQSTTESSWVIATKKEQTNHTEKNARHTTNRGWKYAQIENYNFMTDINNTAHLFMIYDTNLISFCT